MSKDVRSQHIQRILCLLLLRTNHVTLREGGILADIAPTMLDFLASSTTGTNDQEHQT